MILYRKDSYHYIVSVVYLESSRRVYLERSRFDDAFIERRESIWAKSSILAASINGCIPAESRGSLLDEVANLVESPAPLLGRFDPAFLTLPADVLTTVMRKHQRYFPVVSEATGQLLPAFIAVANGKIDEDVVRKGNEAVLSWISEHDNQTSRIQRDRVVSLKLTRPLMPSQGQEKLGSMLDKSMRVEKMVRSLGLAMDLDDSSIATAKEAAPLASADLATAMVMEFTNLAGIMGRHYASKEGYSSAVQEAVFESVLPRYADDILPRSDAGVLLAVADRLDSLVGLFAVGCQPTASADPFGMRRSAYGLVQALVENDKNLNLDKALRIAADTLPMDVPESTLQEVKDLECMAPTFHIHLEPFWRVQFQDYGYSNTNKYFYVSQVSTFVTRRFEQLLVSITILPPTLIETCLFFPAYLLRIGDMGCHSL
ncbi:hypothetical protein Mapa_012254 [Marchantia paleacea]|nr:hypothetical protein Mapa_012254 [Marchantia paleacea]